jgi:hypothetical protein
MRCTSLISHNVKSLQIPMSHIVRSHATPFYLVHAAHFFQAAYWWVCPLYALASPNFRWALGSWRSALPLCQSMRQFYHSFEPQGTKYLAIYNHYFTYSENTKMPHYIQAFLWISSGLSRGLHTLVYIFKKQAKCLIPPYPSLHTHRQAKCLIYNLVHESHNLKWHRPRPSSKS